ncbi:unnamed protein product [Vitrella brassicaformis CCMP3155]|uniref:Ion transport domain-containing protein n=1 Tax=Vitrella brassicaformis (strain CCMP3155) TaxID=1169540 RepID=A0A0G4EG47_VITBC|nr:unnamed protein product [Vitrella brassicaformis CCMP3155]|eukprot:CEL94682.1 unnamed protein product [Vitrella brassicaformis CCMP3155]
MLGFLHGQRTPRLQGQEGDRVRDGHRRPSGVDEACYIQLPRVDEGDAAAQQAIHHTQMGHPKMSASASSEHIPLLQDDGQGLMEPQLPDVTDDITKAPRRFEQVSLVGAPAADDWEPTQSLRWSIRDAIDASDAEGVRKALDGLSPEQTEKVLTTGEWIWGSAIHHAARKCSDVKVFEVLLDNRCHLLNLKDESGRTPLHVAAEKGSVGVVEKFVELGGKGLLEAPGNLDRTPLHLAAEKGHVDVVEWMLRVDPQLLKIKNDYGETPLDDALDRKHPKVVVAMFTVAGDVVMELLETNNDSLNKMLQPEIFPTVLPFVKRGIAERLRESDSLGLDGLRWCSTFRKLTKSRQNDSLTDDFEKTAGWAEALTANFCSDTMSLDFGQSLAGKEKEWFTLLESAEPLTVVTQANCISLVEKHWQPSSKKTVCVTNIAPCDVFMARVLSMLLMVAFVLLHIESIKGDSGMMMAGVWPAVWLWGTVLTGGGFILLEVFQGIRLKAAYWEDSWNAIDCAAALSIAAFIAIHFIGWSLEAEVGSGVVVALLFALRLLQTATLHPTVGPLILPVVRMFSDISMFLCLYVYILLVFAVVFTLLSSDEDHQYFGSLAKAMLTLYSMTPTHRQRAPVVMLLVGSISFYGGLGDFSDPLNNAIESHDTLGAVLLFTYVILSSIILASTFAAIEEKQTAQYQLLRIRVLNEYLTMPHHERLPPPFNLIGVVVSEPLRYVASFISGRQSALCRIAFWSMEALYSPIDVLLVAVAFTPLAIFKGLELVSRAIRVGNSWDPFFTSDATESDSSETADKRREARDAFKDSIDKWIEAADHHDSSVPDVMTALRHFKAYVQDEIHSVVQQMDKRLTELEAYIKAKIK